MDDAAPTTVGVLVRVDPARSQLVAEELGALDGISVFDVHKPGSIGVLMEVADLDTAHSVLRRDVMGVDGVRAAWPVHAHFDPSDARAASEAANP